MVGKQTSYLPNPIEVIEELANVGDRVETISAADEVRWALGMDGQRWVMKRVPRGSVFGEAMAWMLADFLGVPTVERAAVFVPDGSTAPAWLSSNVDGAVEWMPGMRDKLEASPDLGRILSFDAIVGNEDRHARNLLLAPVEGGLVRPVAIDMESILVSTPTQWEKDPDATPPAKVLPASVPALDAYDDAIEFAKAAAGVAEATLHEVVAQAARVSGNHKDGALEALAYRFENAVRLTEKYYTDLKKVLS